MPTSTLQAHILFFFFFSRFLFNVSVVFIWLTYWLRFIRKVFSGCIKNWKAFSKWNPSNGGLDYLQVIYIYLFVFTSLWVLRRPHALNLFQLYIHMWKPVLKRFWNTWCVYVLLTGRKFSGLCFFSVSRCRVELWNKDELT